MMNLLKFFKLEFFKDDYGRLSSSRLNLHGAWLVSSISVLYATWHSALSEWHLAAYLTAFVTGYVANKKLTPAKGDDNV